MQDDTIKLGIYGMRSCEILRGAVIDCVKNIDSSRFIADVAIGMLSTGEVWAAANPFRAVPRNPQRQLATAINRLISFKLGKKATNFKDSLDETITMSGWRPIEVTDCEVYLEGEYTNYWKEYTVTATVKELLCLREILLGHDPAVIISTYGEDCYKEIKGEPTDSVKRSQKERFKQEMIQLTRRHEEESRKEENSMMEHFAKAYHPKTPQRLATLRAEVHEKRLAYAASQMKEKSDLKSKFAADVVEEVEFGSIAYPAA